MHYINGRKKNQKEKRNVAGKSLSRLKRCSFFCCPFGKRQKYNQNSHFMQPKRIIENIELLTINRRSSECQRNLNLARDFVFFFSNKRRLFVHDEEQKENQIFF